MFGVGWYWLSLARREAWRSRRLNFLAASLPVLLAMSCSIIGCPQKKVAGDYYLNQCEGGSYFLDRRTGLETRGDGGKIEGVIQRIGWNDDFIIVNRQGIIPPTDDDWIIIDVRKHEVQDGVSDEELMKFKRENPSVAQMKIYSTEDAWEILK